MGRDDYYRPSSHCNSRSDLVKAMIDQLDAKQKEQVECAIDRAVIYVKYRAPKRQFGRDAAAELVGKTLALLADTCPDDDFLSFVLADNKARCRV